MGFFDDILGTPDTSNSDSSDSLNLPSDYGSSDSDINDILSDPNSDSGTRQLAKNVQAQERTLRSVGIDPGEDEPRSSVLGGVLDVLQVPGQGVRGVLDTALRGDAFTQDPNTGQDIGTGFERGIQEHTNTEDILRRYGVESPASRSILGLAGDLLTDPLTFINPFGAEAGAFEMGGHLLTEGAGKDFIAGAVSNLKNMGVGSFSDLATHEVGVNAGIVGDTLDSVTKAAYGYQQEAQTYLQALREGPGASATLDNSLNRMSQFSDQMKGIVDPVDALNPDIFSQPALRVHANIPFLGNFVGQDSAKAVETLSEDAGPIGQALRVAGKIWNPAHFELANIQIPDAMVDAWQDIKSYANTKLVDLSQAIQKVPVVGPAVNNAVDRTGDFVSAANNMFRKIFLRKTLLTPEFGNTELNYFNMKAAAQNEGIARAAATLGPDVLADKPLQKEAMLAINAQMHGAMDDVGMLPKLPGAIPADQRLLPIINKIATTGELSDADYVNFGDIARNSGAEAAVEQRMNNLYADPNVDPKLKSLIQTHMAAMDSLAQQEANMGIEYSRIAAYVPQEYVNAQAPARIAEAGSSVSGFTRARGYATLADAFKEGGRVANTDLASVLQNRYTKSGILQAQMQFGRRTLLESGLNQETIQKMYREAIQNPGGAAEQALQRYKINVSPINPQLLEDGNYIKSRSEMWAGVGLADPEASRMAGEAATDFAQKVHEEVWGAGGIPKDSAIPDAMLGEIGEKVLMPGTGGKLAQHFYLPKPLADAFNETIAGRDLLKDMANKGGALAPFLRSSINMLDTASSWFKKAATLPWPGYWMRHFTGSRFNQAMEGVHAMDPGIFARAYSLLNGKSAITSKISGLTLTPDVLQRAIRDFGLSYTQNEFLGTVDSLGAQNIDKLMAQKNSMFDNLSKIGSRANREALLAQAQDKLQKGFDGFQRVSFFVHRFEQGDGIADAARKANDVYFNYKDMSPVEQSIFRRFYMFYGYMSKATKQTVTNLLTNPGNLTMQLHGVDALAELFSDPDALPTAEEHDSKLLESAVTADQLERTIGHSPETGGPIRARGFSTPIGHVLAQWNWQEPRNFSISELMDSQGDSVLRSVQKQFATANPVINAMSQIMTGKNLYFDKPLNSDFLRKIPSLNAMAEKYAGYAYDDLPLDLDAPAKEFLNAIPDGKGRLIADTGRLWVLMNLVPGMSRALSTAGAFSNDDVPTSAAVTHALSGIQIDDTDPSRTLLATRQDKLDKIMQDDSVRQRIRNKKNGEDD